MGKTWASDPHERFIAQFEWDGAEALYRADGTGPAYRVTADEFQDFTTAHERRRRVFTWTWVTAVVVVFTILTLVPSARALFAFLPAGWPAFIGSTVYLLPLLVGDFWMRRAPARALRRRTPDAPPLSKEERFRRTIGRQSWQSWFAALIGCALFCAVLGLLANNANPRGDVPPWLLLAIACGLLVYVVVQMLRKWRFQRRWRDEPHAASSFT